MRLGISSPTPAPSRSPNAGRGALATAWMRALSSWLVVGLLLIASFAEAAADRIETEQVAIESHDDGYYLNADFDFDLKPRLAEALDRGLTLFFVVEAELTRSRWYWFDEKTVNATLAYRLSYHALTRQYRVSTGNLQLGYGTLAEALGVMAHVRDWRLADRPTLRIGDAYAAAVRMRLDTTQLPKPFQINAIANRDWTLESDWKRFVFEPR